MDDTVLVFYSDHYAYSASSNLLNKYKAEEFEYKLLNVPFFIYSTSIIPKKIDKVVGQIDVLPTVADILGLDYNPKNYFGNSGFVGDDGFMVFKNQTWLTNNVYFTNNGVPLKLSDDYKISDEYLTKNTEKAKNILKYSYIILEKDYYRIRS